MSTPAGSTPAPTSTHAEMRETHSAYVMLIGDVAYKMKKPVRTDFLDFTTASLRRRALDRECALNARFAPDIYVGVADLTDPAGGPAEPVLRMRRLPDAARLSTLAGTRTREVCTDIDTVARLIASVHAASRRTAAIDREGGRDALTARWLANLSETRSYHAELLGDDVLDEIEARVGTFLGGRGNLFGRRAAEGRVVDGHGDLLGDDIFCMPDGPRILDCLDFDDALRYVDGIDDAACLAMDLEYHRRPDLAQHFIASYREAAADPAPPSLVHHYIAYRAFVRAKVACIRYLQGDEDSRADAVGHALLALDHLRAGTVTLTLIGGLPGTGKSTLATYFADRTDSVVISSDTTRKKLAGADPSDDRRSGVGQGLYTDAMTRRTYDAMSARAQALLSDGRSVVLDATWTNPAMRTRAEELAAVTQSCVVRLECVSPASVALHRVASRVGSGSDATAEVYRAKAAIPSSWHTATQISTDATPTTSGEAAVAHWRHCIATSQASSERTRARS